MEHLFVGHPTGTCHVSWNDSPHQEVNPEFVPTVCKLTGHGIEYSVVLICRSDNRPAAVACTLEEAGFRNVYVMCHGFEDGFDSTRHRSMLNG